MSSPLPLSTFHCPLVMGILNITPDSFSDGGKFLEVEKAVEKAEKMLCEGAAIIDIGAMSSRPNATIISPEEELHRLLPTLSILVEKFPDSIISIDTIHAKTADAALQNGAKIINDISGGDYDSEMLNVVAKHQATFIAMHMRGTPSSMQSLTVYDDVVQEVFDNLNQKIERCQNAGIKNIIADVGFGFAKTIAQNFELLRRFSEFQKLNVPLLAGISRKSMITKTLNINTSEALNGTTVLHTIALQKGASILRAHDVKEAKQCITLIEAMK